MSDGNSSLIIPDTECILQFPGTQWVDGGQTRQNMSAIGTKGTALPAGGLLGTGAIYAAATVTSPPGGARRRARFRASVISAFTRVFRRAMRAHYRVAAPAACFARQRKETEW